MEYYEEKDLWDCHSIGTRNGMQLVSDVSGTGSGNKYFSTGFKWKLYTA